VAEFRHGDESDLPADRAQFLFVAAGCLTLASPTRSRRSSERLLLMDQLVCAPTGGGRRLTTAASAAPVAASTWLRGLGR
jgi:hypothetical protein